MKRDWLGIRVLTGQVSFRVVVCLLLFSLPVLAIAQDPSNEPASEKIPPPPKLVDTAHDTPAVKIVPGKVIRTDVDLALVNVTVTDPYNRLVTGLEQDNFRVSEDGTEQEIVSFSSEDVPISIGVIFDFSGSMSNKVDKAREAALQFFKTANPQDAAQMQAGTDLTSGTLQRVGIPPLLPLRGIRVGTSAREGAR